MGSSTPDPPPRSAIQTLIKAFNHSLVPSEARKVRSAGERQGVWGSGKGAIAPPQYGGLGPCPPKNRR